MNTVLTIGIPAYNDNYGVWATVNTIKTMYHRSGLLKKLELVIVNNAPGPMNPDGVHDSVAAGELRRLTAESQFGRSTIVEMASPIGTGNAKNRVFEAATSPWVMCIDSHLLFEFGVIERLVAFCETHEGDGSLFAGPLLSDGMHVFATHFNDVWSSSMRGQFVRDERGLNPDDEPFEIPAMGCGLLLCRKEDWLGFNPNFYGFGGEEWYIHEKYRQAGHKVICLPWLRWYHNFLESTKARYQIYPTNTVRNFLIGYQELGQPEQIERARLHFVEAIQEGDPPSKTIKAEEFAAIADDPIRYPAVISEQQRRDIATTVRGFNTKEELDKFALGRPEKIARHYGLLKQFASKSKAATILSDKDHFSMTAACYVGGAKSITAFDPLNVDANKTVMRKLALADGIEMTYVQTLSADTPEAELMLIDLPAKEISEALNVFVPRSTHYFAIHRTGDAEALEVVRTFLRDNSNWSVVDRSDEGEGIIVLSCVSADKPQVPGLLTQAKNFAKSLSLHVVNGHPIAPDDVQAARLSVCDLCPERNGKSCTQCGCNLPLKASWADMSCPLGKWTAIAEKQKTTLKTVTVEQPVSDEEEQHNFASADEALAVIQGLVPEGVHVTADQADLTTCYKMAAKAIASSGNREPLARLGAAYIYLRRIV